MKHSILFSITLFLFLFISTAAFADLNGTHWKQLSQTEKIAFVRGFDVGTDYVFAAEMERYTEDFKKGFDMKRGQSLSQKIHDKKHKITFTNDEIIFWGQFRSATRSLYLTYYLTELTTEQIINGLDAFYQDFKNSGINLPDAIYVVKRQIKGMSNENIEQILLYLRGGKKDKNLLKIKDSDMKLIFP